MCVRNLLVLFVLLCTTFSHHVDSPLQPASTLPSTPSWRISRNTHKIVLQYGSKSSSHSTPTIPCVLVCRCLRQLGCNHSSLVSLLVPELLSTHPFFMGKEPDEDDPACEIQTHTTANTLVQHTHTYTHHYNRSTLTEMLTMPIEQTFLMLLVVVFLLLFLDICILILVFNAAASCPVIPPLFPSHVFRHYTYLRDTLPHLIPHIKVTTPIGGGANNNTVCIVLWISH